MQEQFKAWWESISQREQLLTAISVSLCLVAIIYWGAWQPLVSNLEESKQKMRRAEQTLVAVQEQSILLLQTGGANKTAVNTNANISQIITKSAQQYGISFSRIVNRRDQVEVLITSVEFDRFINWLTALANDHSISVINIDMSREDKLGYIKINRLSLGY
ncbi:MAG: type II secretion system protein M [Psychromonas sp.]